ncbi:MAG: hypothetical protein AAFU03_07950, partial [Bacteroidota bacterium]
NVLAYVTFGSTILMFVGAFLVINLFGFNVTGDLEGPPVQLYLEPAGYAFIIWGFIYLGFIGLGAYQLREKVRGNVAFQRARGWIILNAISNLTWFAGVLTNQLGVTVVCMMIMLFTLIQLSILLELGKAGGDWREKLFVKLPLALYFGWITVASVVNTTAWLLTDLGWTGEESLGPQGWSVLMLSIATGIIVSLFVTRKVNGAYLLVGVWALIAIYVANASVGTLVAYTAIGLAAFLLIVLFIPQPKGKPAHLL